jgi:transcriptional regulator with XRE-family HTH domain
MKPFHVKNRSAALYAGQRVREFRQAARWSQVELSAGFDWPWHTTVSAIERGERQVSAVELWRIARALGRSLEEFFPAPFSAVPPARGKGAQGGPREGGNLGRVPAAPGR